MDLIKTLHLFAGYLDFTAIKIWKKKITLVEMAFFKLNTNAHDNLVHVSL